MKPETVRLPLNLTREGMPGAYNAVRSIADSTLRQMDGAGNERRFTLSFSSEEPLEKMMREKAPISSGIRVEETGEQDFRRDASDALMLRSSRVAVEKPSDGARQLSAMSLRDLAIECLSREGRGTNDLLRMSSDDLYTEMTRQFYNPTAAFPAILDQTIRKSIVHLYNRVPTTFQEITTKGSLKDFKQTADHEYVIGGVGDFLLVPEKDEV